MDFYFLFNLKMGNLENNINNFNMKIRTQNDYFKNKKLEETVLLGKIDGPSMVASKKKDYEREKIEEEKNSEARIESPNKVSNENEEIEPKKIYSDLDINNHVNNSRYIDWFCDQIPLEIHKKGILSEISVSYSREIRSGSDVKLEFSRTDNQFRMAGKENNQVCFMVNATWKEETL